MPNHCRAGRVVLESIRAHPSTHGNRLNEALAITSLAGVILDRIAARCVLGRLHVQTGHHEVTLVLLVGGIVSNSHNQVVYNCKIHTWIGLDTVPHRIGDHIVLDCYVPHIFQVECGVATVYEGGVRDVAHPVRCRQGVEGNCTLVSFVLAAADNFHAVQVDLADLHVYAV